MSVVHDIHGGIHPPEEKQLSNPGTIYDLPLPAELILPLSQHAGRPAEVCVSVGDRVLGGQLIADSAGVVSAALHAPTSGVVTAIEDRAVPHPSGLDAPCVVIQVDGEDKWQELEGKPQYWDIEPSLLIEKIRAAGVAGLGGAGFPTAVKLSSRDGSRIDTVIINGTECEPYITADDTLMQTDAMGIIEGAELLAFIVGAKTILFGVEDNKPKAAQALRAGLALVASRCEREVIEFPTKYPSGGERQLIEILTGKQVPSGSLPADLGILCHNPGTAVAARDAIIDGRPLTSRIVTVTGRSVARPGNVRALLGTPISHVLDCAGIARDDLKRLVHGGPMMGFTLAKEDVPVIKTTNCILAAARGELAEPSPAQACIRCGHCAEVCPASLLPQQLYWYAKARDQEQLEQHNLFDCIECGACAYVCPSNIPLVQYYRAAKATIVEVREEKQRAERSRERFENRQARVERELAEKEAKRAARKAAAQEKAANSSGDDPVQAAIARAKARKAQSNTEQS